MKLGFIGTGAMSGAIARGVHASGNLDADMYLFDRFPAAAHALAEEVGGQVADSAADLICECDVVVLGVKPNVQTQVLEELAPHLTGDCQPTLISIAAGRPLSSIEEDLAAAALVPSVVRVMPNMNAAIGQSMSAVAGAKTATRRAVEDTLAVFSAVGDVMELPEELFPVYSALAGCSPAWFFHIADALAQAGVAHGMTKQQALQAVTQSMLGSAGLLQAAASEGDNPAVLIDRVCSPGGTTVAGLLAAQAAGLGPALVAAVNAAVAKDNELSGK